MDAGGMVAAAWEGVARAEVTKAVPGVTEAVLLADLPE